MSEGLVPNPYRVVEDALLQLVGRAVAKGLPIDMEVLTRTLHLVACAEKPELYHPWMIQSRTDPVWGDAPEFEPCPCKGCTGWDSKTHTWRFFMKQASDESGTLPCPTAANKVSGNGQFFGTLWIAYGELRLLETPLGVGTETDLVVWARALLNEPAQEDDDEPGESTGVWIVLLPTDQGRIPWERGDALKNEALLLEGDIHEDFAADMPVRRISGTVLN